ncbi:MAG TPA: phage protein GemA/Gp16 family protein [Armatimonadota bacterium]|nr:phage protein GemA/Gp16 family protein [Armatimonadota bacterium]
MADRKLAPIPESLMPSIAKQRRALFALYRLLGIAEEARHDVQAAHTGKPSLRDWTPDDFDRTIAALQRAAGQHRDPHAHVREDREPSEASAKEGRDADGWATEGQARYIEDICDRVNWKTGRQLGPRRYACHTVLSGPANALRRRQIEYDGCAVRSARVRAWLALTRAEASDLIKALRKLARVNPRPQWEPSKAD